MTITGCFPVLLSCDVRQARLFYERFFGFVPSFESEWYVQLAHPTQKCELAVMTTQHDSLPAAAQVPAAGVLLSFEVADAAAEHDRLSRLGAVLLHGLRDEAWGQRHFLVQGPDRVLVDIIERIDPTAEYADAYAGAAP